MQDRIVRSLSEDFAKIGWDKGAGELRRLSSNRLDESLYSVPAIAAVTADPIDGPVVTAELLSRIADLDFDTLSESDCDDLLDGLREKELPEGDDALAEAAEAVVKAILESKFKIVKSTIGGKRSKRANRGYRTVDGKIEKIAAGERVAQSRKNAKNYKKTKGKRKIYAKNRGARLAAKRERMGLSADDMSDGLVLELNNILGEGSEFGEYGDTVSRVARIMSLIEQLLGREVGDVLESAYETMQGSLLAENSDPQRAFGPALKVIARCLEQIDGMGND